MKPELLIKGSVLSEKAMALAEKNVYTLKVHLKATKADIKAALKDVFGVEVVRVRTLITRGDETRRSRGKGSSASVTVKKPNVKKALVELKKGQVLPAPNQSMTMDSEG